MARQQAERGSTHFYRWQGNRLSVAVPTFIDGNAKWVNNLMSSECLQITTSEAGVLDSVVQKKETGNDSKHAKRSTKTTPPY